tara:strand:+ start:1036 stop:1800 length:765 start_codon:yes stop_codon:yes gene_type:complete
MKNSNNEYAISDKFSIIMPCFNAEKFIKKSIDSVLIQTYKNFELIIVDDQSTDRSAKIINKYLDSDSRLKFIQLKRNSGAGAARNVGLKNTTGRYIAFLDSDDRWHKNKLMIYTRLFKRGHDFLYSNYIKITDNKRKNIMVPECIDYKMLLKSNFIPLSSAAFDSKLLGNLKFLKMGNAEDYYFWLSMFHRVKNPLGVQRYLMYYMVTGENKSRNKLKMFLAVWTIYRKHLRLNWLWASYLICHYAKYGISKKL